MEKPSTKEDSQQRPSTKEDSSPAPAPQTEVNVNVGNDTPSED